MENKVLPAVRVPTVYACERAEDGGVAETPILDLPSSQKFGFAWPDKSKAVTVAPISPDSAAEPDSSEFDSEAESQASRDSTPVTGDRDSADRTPTNETPTSNVAPGQPVSPPRLSRAFSMPLPAQLGHLKNPHRSPDESAYLSPLSSLALSQLPNVACFQELSLELADSVQMVIQTLLQISPPHLLDPAKEQFSACSLSVPSPSISAMLTTMKNLNYMSANISTFADTRLPPDLRSTGLDLITPHHSVQEDFDVGEMLQSVGDALSSFAAQAGVEIVLFHGDAGMKHVSVRGDECGISYALSHIIRQVLDTAQRGDTLEIGLSITAGPARYKERKDRQDNQESDEQSRSSSRASSTIPDIDGILQCTFDVGHKFATPDSNSAMENHPTTTASTSLYRAKPRLDTIFFRRLLTQIGGTIKEDLKPRLFSPGRSCELSVVLEAGSVEIMTHPTRLSAEEEAMRQPYANMNIQLASEPSLDELVHFVESLKGKKVALHASSKGSFAHHLTSYLTAWGLDVSHMSVPVSETWSAMEDIPDTQSAGSEGSIRTSPTATMTDSPVPVEVNPIEEQLREKAVGNPAFILIDDDVDALRQRLIQLRSESPFNLSLRQRPKLAAAHRPKSSPQIVRAKGIKPSFTLLPQPSPHPVIIHFTSLPNYKLVKDMIHSVLSSPSSSNLIPEIIVLPKPAGPRRLLTALRTAILKPIVDPFFTPIATSPMSPNGQGVNPFSPYLNNASPLQKGNRPSPRTASDRSSRSSKEAVELAPRLPPSPLRDSDSMEYFSEAAAKLGTSPSSGLVIQSPDGQPAGIFFHPRGAGSKQRPGTGTSGASPVVNPPNLVRDVGKLRAPGEHRRSSLPRRVSTPAEGDAPPGDRPKLPSQSQMFSRNWNGLTYYSDATSVATEAPSSQPFALIWPRTTMTPREELGALQPPNSAPTPPVLLPPTDIGHIPRMSPVVDTRKVASPPTSPISNRTATPAQKRNLTQKGTTDSASVPTTPTTKKGKQSADGNIVPPVNVLIVEDNPINQTILSTFLRKKKIKYDVAKNGAEAVTKWKTGGFHLILMDIQMPVMDGIEATKEIRRLERQTAMNTFPSTPPSDDQQTPSDAPSTESKSSSNTQTPFRSSVIIVALTASSLQTDRVAALAAGCNDFLTKPVSLLWLNNKIIEWGSIKALQMWADLRPEVVKNITSGQLSQAKSIASKLHVPENRKMTRIPSSSSIPKPVSSATSQIDAMLMLSSPARSFAIPRDLDHTESEQSESEARVLLNITKAPTPTAKTESRSSSVASSVPAETLPEDNSRSKPPSCPTAHREVSGEEALHAHIKDSAGEASSIAECNTRDRPVVLGERTINSGEPSIAEMMHNDSGFSAVVDSSTSERTAEPDISKNASNSPSSMTPAEDRSREEPAGDPPQAKDQ